MTSDAVSVVIVAARARIEESRSPVGRTPSPACSERTFASIRPLAGFYKSLFRTQP